FKGGNSAIRDHLQNGKDLHLFTQLGKGLVRYEGALHCTGFHNETTKGTDGRDRRAIIFELAPIEEQDNSGRPVEDDEADQLRSKDLSLEELRRRAVASAAPFRDAKSRKTAYRERSIAIKFYARRRASGNCEACKAPAPFRTVVGEPFLEVHH